jgi:hypothetical protein
MRLNEITESFDREAVEWTTRTDDEWTAVKTIGEQEITCLVERIAPVVWTYSFSARRTGKTGYNPDRMVPTGQGRSNALQSLGFVVSALTDFIERVEPQNVMFSGDASGLAGLFHAMAKYLEPRLEALGYHVAQSEDGKHFTIQPNSYEVGQTIGRR